MSNVAAGPTLMSQLASLSRDPADADTAARMVNRANAVSVFIAFPSWVRIDVRSRALLSRSVRECRTGRTDEDAADGDDERPRAYCRRTAVAERGGVELAGQAVADSSIAELCERHPVLARAWADRSRNER